MSLCEGTFCGHNAQCIVSAAGPTCACLEGMVGNPHPGGQCHTEACASSSQCSQAGQVCQSGRCVFSCGQNSCGLFARCDALRRACVCEEGFVGDPNLVCMPPTLPATCSPGCGPNGHCAYGRPNKCECNAGHEGNPYSGCRPFDNAVSQTLSCAGFQCGASARWVSFQVISEFEVRNQYSFIEIIS